MAIFYEGRLFKIKTVAIIVNKKANHYLSTKENESVKIKQHIHAALNGSSKDFMLLLRRLTSKNYTMIIVPINNLKKNMINPL